MKTTIKLHKFVKTLLALLFVFCLLQIVTLKLLAEKKKLPSLIEDLQLLVYVNQFDSVAFNSEVVQNEKLVYAALKNRFKDTIDNIKICEINTWNNYRIDSNFLAIRVVEFRKNKFTFSSTTEAGTLHYGEVWENKYIWFLFRWIKLKHKNKGVG